MRHLIPVGIVIDDNVGKSEEEMVLDPFIDVALFTQDNDAYCRFIVPAISF
jgi:ribosome biogenesis protein Tsr3